MQRTQRFWTVRGVRFIVGGSEMRKALGYAPWIESRTSLGVQRET